MKRYTASRLRENIYSVLDEILATGIPVELERNGKRLRIVPELPVSKLARLKPRKVVKGDIEGIVSIDWSKEWSEKI